MRPRALAAIALAVLVALTALPALRWVLWQRELNPLLRGERLAEAQGCFTCHRPWGRREIPNPGSRWASVPRFAAGNARMYAEDRREIEEFIRYGAPRAWLEDPAVVERLERQRIRMPAYAEHLGEDEIAVLVAFAAAVERVELPGGETVELGRDVAWKHACVVCHGVEGAGGLANPGSLGGFVPGFVGGNFPDMVRDEAEFREWVREGTSSRLAAYPLIPWFWKRQRISMPAYGEQISDEELERLWAWVGAIRGEGRPPQS